MLFEDISSETSNGTPPSARAAVNPILSELVKVLFCSWANLFLILSLVGFAVNYTHQSPTVIFAVNFVAIIGPSGILEFSVTEIKRRSRPLISNLVNITFSNSVQLITSIMLLRNHQVVILQTSLVGSLLSNMHLMLGLGFLAGGIKYPEQTFSTEATKEVGTLLLLAVMAIAIPTVSHAWSDKQHTVPQSRATTFVLVVTYVIFLYFQIYSHKPLFEVSPEHEDSPDIENKTQIVVHGSQKVDREGRTALSWKNSIPVFSSPEKQKTGIADPPHAVTTLITLTIATALIGFHSTFATDNLSSLMDDAHISSTFIGVVILPLLSNDIGPIRAAWHNKMDQCIASTVGKCIQTSLVVIPLIIFIAWVMGVDTMSLDFDGFEVITLFMSALSVNFVIANGKCNYFEGVALIALFIVISIAANYY